MTRHRTLAKTLCTLALAVPCLGAGTPRTATPDRPNILFIMSDDHCARAVGAYGLRLAKLDPTPNLDRLARDGMLFENVFCTNSICTPSRASILTGQYWMHMAHGHNNPGHFGIRTKQHKLIFFYGTDYTDTHNKRLVTRHEGNRFWKSTPAAWEFYDLSQDPREMHNRYCDPDYQEIIRTLKAELKELRQELGDTDQQHPRIREIINAHWND
jgi:arylsulfatase A-like enzyme